VIARVGDRSGDGELTEVEVEITTPTQAPLAL